ncbi:hypothetical protein [Polynucleobacter sp. CS-Odin-A6]|uniref:hypothetical protein n=1 Tax=Polynucleobacter sp. CS-Odin-A6 TaxID=2689106 RepID=UPI001C0C52F8|nr:hypothetical protein [Polynucleobacter sp. CS-Odin-A6]MBU3622015.1 hypothetical protein [Polynucleobacter sp. CS-Odin-A6]
MNALFLSTLRKQLRGWIALSFLVVSLLGTHWIGFVHSITHSGIQHHNSELSCIDQAPTFGHSSANCHLLDALTLAGFVPADPATFAVQTPFKTLESASDQTTPIRIQAQLYQSRAPPSLIL